MTSHRVLWGLIVAPVFLVALVSCDDGPKVHTPEPQSADEPEVHQDFGDYQALKTEVLLRERTSSLVKFVKYEDHFLLGFGDEIQLTLALFLKTNGDAYVFASWVYPEYLESGGTIWRTSESVHSSRWSLTEQGSLTVGEGDINILLTPDAEGYTGDLNPTKYQPPPKPVGLAVPDRRTSFQGHQIRFEVVSEALEAEIVDAIF